MEEVGIQEFDPVAMQAMINENRRIEGMPPQSSKSSDQFTLVEDHGRRSFIGYTAVWNRRDGQHVALCAPTLEQLEKAWEAIVNHPLNRERVQKVLLVSATSTPDGG